MIHGELKSQATWSCSNHVGLLHILSTIDTQNSKLGVRLVLEVLAKLMEKIRAGNSPKSGCPYIRGATYVRDKTVIHVSKKGHRGVLPCSQAKMCKQTILSSQYHGCCLPGDTCRQAIRSHDVGLCLQEYSSFNTARQDYQVLLNFSIKGNCPFVTQILIKFWRKYCNFSVFFNYWNKTWNLWWWRPWWSCVFFILYFSSFWLSHMYTCAFLRTGNYVPGWQMWAYQN